MPAEVAPFPACHRAVGWGLGYRDQPVPPHEAVTTGDPSLGGTVGARSRGLSPPPDPAHSRFFALFQGRGRGDGKRMLHPLLPRPTLGCSPAPLALCCRFQSEQGSDAKPHGAAEAGTGSRCARPHLPPGLWATCVLLLLLLLGVTGCCWLCQGAEPLVWGLSRCHRFGICCKGLPLARDHCREHFLCNFLVLKRFLKLH